VIEGHTNEIGSHQYNLVLSRKRANSVKEYLVSRGIEAGLLAPVGYGKSRPKSAGKELSKMAKLEIDRRVEFKVVAPTQTVVKPAQKSPVTSMRAVPFKKPSA
jgi:outer membrane protein OmpA-like peptidoglycan-associated protein